MKMKKDGMAGDIAHSGEMVNAYKITVLNPEGKRPLGRHGHRWEENIKMDFMK
jgi:hypothetical protein